MRPPLVFLSCLLCLVVSLLAQHEHPSVSPGQSTHPSSESEEIGWVPREILDRMHLNQLDGADTELAAAEKEATQIEEVNPEPLLPHPRIYPVFGLKLLKTELALRRGRQEAEPAMRDVLLQASNRSAKLTPPVACFSSSWLPRIAEI